MEIGGTTAGRAVPFDADRPRASHAELRGRGKPSRHTDGCTCTFPGVTMPGIVMFALTRIRTHVDEGAGRERNSTVKVLRPFSACRSATATTISMYPDSRRNHSPPHLGGRPASVAPGGFVASPQRARPATAGQGELFRDHDAAILPCGVAPQGSVSCCRAQAVAR
jgi:hypothetical protein